MRLDADEVIEPDLADEIRNRLPTLDRGVAGVNLKRKHIFMGRWVRHGGRFPLVLLRIWRNGQGRVEQRWMDEHIVVWNGSSVTFAGGFADHNLNNLTFFTDKHNAYATREAIDVLRPEIPPDAARPGPDAGVLAKPRQSVGSRSGFTIGCRSGSARSATSSTVTSSSWGFWMAGPA